MLHNSSARMYKVGVPGIEICEQTKAYDIYMSLSNDVKEGNDAAKPVKGNASCVLLLLLLLN